MAEPKQRLAQEESEALRLLLENTAEETGEDFFASLVRNLASALGTHGAWVTEYVEETRTLHAISFWLGGEYVDDWQSRIDGTPCAVVIEGRRLVHFPDRVLELFPGDRDVQVSGAVSYLGVPLFDVDGRVLGHLAVLDNEPMAGEPRLYALFRLFAARAAAEVRRLRRERALAAHERKLRALVDGALDAIVELAPKRPAAGSPRLAVTRVNPAAEKLFAAPAEHLIGADFVRYFDAPDRDKLRALIAELDAREEGPAFLWIPGGLDARTPSGRRFRAEASLSRYEVDGEVFHGLILRDVNDRLEAEPRISTLESETEYLRAEIQDLLHEVGILGRSPRLHAALGDVAQVAPTDASVLVLGETGTGKEVFARAVHSASARRERAFIKVNCAAIPATLIESELFGHEKGAFTGATARREGRFGLADGGTLFLDEVGELPLELQPKLLRVVQEGEFEPVGSSRTRKVDVRVVSATHRDLERMVADGRFREDLYYRLNVFPIQVPPLRERGDDVVLLAQAFVERFARRMGRVIRTTPEELDRRLSGYDWPGNVRELQNVIERAVITARDGQLNFERALPEAALRLAVTQPVAAGASTGPGEAASEPPIRTAREMESLERANLLRALERVSWKVAGERGAAALLGMAPSTLSSRMKALGLQRPR